MSTPAQEFYGRWATLYDWLARYTPGIRTLRSRAAAACRCSPGDTVVEMGCGTGANLPYLADRVGPDGHVVGVDFTRPALDRARRVVDRADPDATVSLVHADASRAPFGPDAVGGEGVDAILGSFVVGMFADPGSVVDGWCDLVRPGGHVVLVDAARSDRRFAGPLNAVFRAVVVASTPPTLRFRYDRSPTASLDERVAAARRALRERSEAVADHESLYGVVRTTGGRIAARSE